MLRRAFVCVLGGYYLGCAGNVIITPRFDPVHAFQATVASSHAPDSGHSVFSVSSPLSEIPGGLAASKLDPAVPPPLHG